MFVREMGLQWEEPEDAAQRSLDHARLAGNRLMMSRSDRRHRLLGAERTDPGERRDRPLHEIARGGARRSEAGGAAALLLCRDSRRCAGTSKSPDRCIWRSRASLEELGWTFLAAQTSFDSAPVEMLNEISRRRRPSSDATTSPSSGWARPTTSRPRRRCWRGPVPARRPGRRRGAHEDQRGARRPGRCHVAVPVAERAREDPVRARRRGDGGEAGQEAVELIRTSDDINSQGDALIDLARCCASRAAPPRRRRPPATRSRCSRRRATRSRQRSRGPR